MQNNAMRRLSIILLLQRGYLSGRWEEAEGEQDAIRIEGEERIRWDGEVWGHIAANLQLNPQQDACRILLCSDRELRADELPALECSWSWEIEELAKALPIRSARRWYLNGVSLHKRFVRLFPETEKKAETVYLYTLPRLELPSPKQGLTPLYEIMRNIRSIKQKRTVRF